MSSDTTSETIQKILDIARPEVHEVIDALGRAARYSTKPLTEIKAKAPELSALVDVNTLTGFADLVKAQLETLATFEGYLIHIEDEGTVVLKAKQTDEYGRRESLIQAKPVKFDRFQFGRWQDQETFAIEVAAKFADSPDKDYVLKMASTMTNDATSTTEDDGFTQRASIKAGLRMKEQVTIKPRVALAPYRTFPEVEQPLSEFVFRAKASGEGVPHLMLVEADGGRWKVAAIAALKEAMGAFGLGISIIA